VGEATIPQLRLFNQHLGIDADFKALVDAAHARGMKVYMDIIANHTADVIQYRECTGKSDCIYRSRADYPYSTKGRNSGFDGDQVMTVENFARLADPSFAYTPFVPDAEKSVKVPAWLNDPIYYHNRGNTTFANESSQIGDFVGLDDLMTKNPRVVAGMIDIFGGWIDRFGIDGYRIDTARHVNPAFWAAFVPAPTRGRQLLRAREANPGLLAISRFDPTSGVEVLLLFNTSTQPITAMCR
jgi:glycosidase